MIALSDYRICIYDDSFQVNINECISNVLFGFQVNARVDLETKQNRWNVCIHVHLKIVVLRLYVVHEFAEIFSFQWQKSGQKNFRDPGGEFLIPRRMSAASRSRGNHGFEVCIVGMQRNKFSVLIKVYKQWKFYLNLCFKIILYYETLNLHKKLILLV